jgi:hypothetical protein
MRFEVAPTSTRVQASTAPEINDRIRRETDARIAYFTQEPELIENRLIQLENEWDIERVLEMNAAGIAFTGTAFAVVGSRKWLAVPLVVAGFLFQHALQGWCPPLPLLRRLGFRTPQEIAEERRRLLGIIERLAISETAAETI